VLDRVAFVVNNRISPEISANTKITVKHNIYTDTAWTKRSTSPRLLDSER